MSVFFEGGGGDGVEGLLSTTFLITTCTAMEDEVRQAPSMCKSLQSPSEVHIRGLSREHGVVAAHSVLLSVVSENLLILMCVRLFGSFTVSRPSLVDYAAKLFPAVILRHARYPSIHELNVTHAIQTFTLMVAPLDKACSGLWQTCSPP